jgi:hypothetical protein
MYRESTADEKPWHVSHAPPLTSLYIAGMKTLVAMLLMVVSAHAAAAKPRDADFNAVFDRHKGRIYALYRKALQNDPRLAGKIVYDIDIAKTGDVTGCRVRSSTLGSPALEGKICEVILQIKVPAQPAGFTITKPVDFFPAG